MFIFEAIKHMTYHVLYKVNFLFALYFSSFLILVVFIENIARYLKIDRPKPFEIIIPKKTNQTEEARTTSMCYGLDLDEDGGKTLAAEVMFSTHSKLYGFTDRRPNQEVNFRAV